MPRHSGQRGAVLAGLRGVRAAELIAQSGNRVVGFCLGRDGRIAAHIGPLVAEDDAIARAILARAIASIETPLFIDLAYAKTEGAHVLGASGFAPVRPFTRMLHRRSTRFDDPARTFAVVGAEFG